MNGVAVIERSEEGDLRPSFHGDRACMPASRWPGIRQAYSNVPALVNFQRSSPLLNGEGVMTLGRRVFMSPSHRHDASTRLVAHIDAM
jgi:hypothetical protein